MIFHAKIAPCIGRFLVLRSSISVLNSALSFPVLEFLVIRLNLKDPSDEVTERTIELVRPDDRMLR